MTVHNFTREELSLVRLALLTFRAHSEQEALTMDEWARDETFEEATRDQCRRNAEASRSFARRAGVLLDAPSSPLDPTPAKPEAIRVVVALEGGLVQGAVTDRPGVSVMTIDYDVEGADADDVLAIPQDNGDTAEAIRGGVSAEFNPAWIDAAERAELADPAAAIELLRRRAAKYQESHPNLAADALRTAEEIEKKHADELAELA